MRGAAYRLSFRPDELGTCVIIAVDAEGHALPVSTGYPWGEVPKLKRKLARVLRDSRDALGVDGDRCDFAMAHDFLRQIDDSGQEILATLCGRTNLDTLRNFLYRKPLPPGMIDQSTLWPLIEFETPSDDFMPLEVMPFADRTPIAEIHDFETLSQAVMRFPGFAAVTRRLTFSTGGSSGNALAGTRIPMKMFVHHDFEGARREAKFLTDEFDLVGPWPRTDSDQSSATALSMILDCRRPTPVGEPPIIDQIQHFSCHCSREDEDAFLQLCAEGRDPFEIMLSNFQSAVGRLAGADYERPLVFLNACNSNSPEFFDYTTWALAFYRLSSRAVIATEAPAPDLFASAFSREFYAAILNGQPVGHSLLTAKWKLLQRWNNPMGLLYTLFGNPDLRASYLEGAP